MEVLKATALTGYSSSSAKYLVAIMRENNTYYFRLYTNSSSYRFSLYPCYMDV